MTEEITTVTLQQKATLDLVEELRTFLYMDHNVLYGRIQAQRRFFFNISNNWCYYSDEQ